MYRLSIITVNLNNYSGLRKTIESVVSQTYSDIEYIVIDGDSTDSSVNVIKEYSDKITYWVSEPDTGIYQAMNKGIRKATGEYCQFLNSGDRLVAPDVTENMLGLLTDAGILIGNMLKILPDGKIFHDKGTGFGNITFLTFYKGTLNHSAAYIKRSLFDKYGLYDECLRIVSDWKWYLLAVGLKNESVVHRDIDVTLFDMTGISTTHHELVKKERQKVLEELLPVRILADYDQYFTDVEQVKRLKRYSITSWFFWFIERVLFHLEKWKLTNS